MNLKNIFNNKAQSVAEYSLLAMLVLSGVLVMGPYVVRSWNAQMKGWEDSIVDSYTDPLQKVGPIGVPVLDCTCSLQPPCSVPPCCGMGGCAGTEDALVEVCGPANCVPTLMPDPTDPTRTVPYVPQPTQCTSEDTCCLPPSFIGICGGGGCGPTQRLANITCGGTVGTNTRCVGDPSCAYKCLPPPEHTLIRNAQLCYGDDDNISGGDLPYNYVDFGSCSSRKCELECLQSFITSANGCVCPVGELEIVGAQCPFQYCDQGTCQPGFCADSSGLCNPAPGTPIMESRFIPTPNLCAFGYTLGIEVRVCLEEKCAPWVRTQDPSCVGCIVQPAPPTGTITPP